VRAGLAVFACLIVAAGRAWRAGRVAGQPES